MRLLELVAPVFGARCCLLVGEDGTCVAVDVGAGVADRVAEVVGAQGWRPAAVLATHGHADHTWGAGPLAAAWDVPVVLHAADAHRLADPFGTLGPLGRAAHDPTGPLGQALAAAGLAPGAYVAPTRVEPFGDAADARTPDVVLAWGGVRLVARHAPGHTEGATLYLVEVATDGPAGPGGRRAVALTGDVLFAGSVGRTDLPGGDDARMRTTLAEVVATLPPETLVVPGHGPTSTVAAELAANPYLAPYRQA
ncbi:MBL fold metallo-hydrolase [Cellulomonas endophytica]|uniref:MBL fold metallo-hydrolase n=1 Tax=Cellulomonas endophytica TaxID=2494735 RepID=UPI001010EA84|nr:MBL fold metallo-hydrolase [Cellulomonas endophytica]